MKGERQGFNEVVFTCQHHELKSTNKMQMNNVKRLLLVVKGNLLILDEAASCACPKLAFVVLPDRSFGLYLNSVPPFVAYSTLEVR
jgi:hypothetical protein